MRRKLLIGCSAMVVAAAAILSVLYLKVARGLSSDRTEPPAAETILATWLLHQSVSDDARKSVNPLKNDLAIKYYDWPVGYDVGKNLKDYWKLEEHKLGDLTFTHFPDGTAHKNRMQGNDFAQSLMYARGVTCFSCHDPHGTENVAMVRKPGNPLCLDCHGPNAQAGPHAASIEEHTHHQAGSAGNECIACHMPKIEETISDQKVRSHTFHFVTPSETEALIQTPAMSATRINPSSGRRLRWSRGRIAHPGECRDEARGGFRT
jgi:predicted CXXCH cytochrome family protein